MIPNSIDLQVDGESREIKMSYGLLDELARVIGDVDSIGGFSLVPEMREAVLNAVLAKRDHKGKIVSPVNFFEIDLDTETANAILDWVAGHVLDFFLKRLTTAKTQVEARQKDISALMPTSAGGKR